MLRIYYIQTKRKFIALQKMSWIWILIILFVIMIVVVLVMWWLSVNTTYILLIGGFFFLIILLMIGYIAMEPAPKRVAVMPPPPIVQPAPTVIVHEHTNTPVMQSPPPVQQFVPYREPEPIAQPPASATYQTFHFHTQGQQGAVYDDYRTEYEMPTAGTFNPMSGDVIPDGTAYVNRQQVGEPSVNIRPYQQNRYIPGTQRETQVTDRNGNVLNGTVKTPGLLEQKVVNPPEMRTRVLRPGERCAPQSRCYRDLQTGEVHEAY